MNIREAAEYALEALTKAGATEASCKVTDGYEEEFNADAGEFSLYRTLFNSGLNMKALLDGRKGTANINRLDKDAIDEAVTACVAAAVAAVPDESEGIAEKITNKDFISGVLTPDKDRFYDRVKEYVDEVRSRYPGISLEQFIAKYVRNNVLFLNTNGVEFKLDEGYYNYMSMFSGVSGDKRTSFNGYGAVFQDLDRGLLDIGLSRTLLEETLRQFDPKPVSSKFVGTVVFTPDCLDNMLYMVLQIFTGDGNMIDGSSIWKDKLHKSVAHPSLTVSLNPGDNRVVCGQRFTDDGYESTDYDVIKNGVLNGFMLSRYGSKKTGHKRAGNLSGNLVVPPGDKSLDEIIAGIDNGLLVSRFSGGWPAVNGDFSGVAKNSFAIEKGRVTGPVNETMISGNLEAIFNNISGISKETAENGYSSLPWLAVDGVTVSGPKES